MTLSPHRYKPVCCYSFHGTWTYLKNLHAYDILEWPQLKKHNKGSSCNCYIPCFLKLQTEIYVVPYQIIHAAFKSRPNIIASKTWVEILYNFCFDFYWKTYRFGATTIVLDRSPKNDSSIVICFVVRNP